MSYRTLEIWKTSKQVAEEIHAMTLTDLPKFEMYEQGSQIRRSSKSVNSNIVEGYGRRIYKGDYIKFLIYAQSSNDETINHLELLYNTKSLRDQEKYNRLHKMINTLGIKINRFIQKIRKDYRPPNI